MDTTHIFICGINYDTLALLQTLLGHLQAAVDRGKLILVNPDRDGGSRSSRDKIFGPMGQILEKHCSRAEAVNPPGMRNETSQDDEGIQKVDNAEQIIRKSNV